MLPAAVDVAAGCVLVASLLAPLTPLIALAIKLDSPGPVLSRQQDPPPDCSVEIDKTLRFTDTTGSCWSFRPGTANG